MTALDQATTAADRDADSRAKNLAADCFTAANATLSASVSSASSASTERPAHVGNMGPPEELIALWRQLRREIHKRVQPEQFETWFRRANLASMDSQSLCVAVQNGFSKDWLHNYYREVIEDAMDEVLGRTLKLSFVVDPELALKAIEDDDLAPLVHESAATGEHGGREGGEPPTGSGAGALKRNGANSSLVRGSDVGLNPKYTFDNFVVGPCNRFSHAVSLGTAEAPGKAYNPLFLHGNVGLGKTHLLQSICAALLDNWADVRILFLSCETFVNHFISALENGDLQKFRNKYRNVDVLVVDDIHVLANKERTQEEFFHTFNTLYNAGKQIVLSSDLPPKDIPTLQNRLVSRFKWGLVTEIELPCYETRMAILKRKGRERGEDLPNEVAQLIAERVDTNIRELEGAVNRLYGFASVSGEKITVPFAREVLADLFVKRRGAPTMEDIIVLVTAHYGVKLAELQSKRRTNQIALPRQMAMYLARQVTRLSLEEVGGYFGGRDHSTVLHAVKKITGLVQTDEATRSVVVGFLDQLGGASS
ncbi:MAG: chromosomal replication initiator protein DnaA [bacterium]|jgi:chromosomal replication initiator protein|nr:chromosomal replication initiator protein DnaA [Planctomycetota bacterium]HIL50619.1 chromosomal replication initiator protein DnaA [Planctomycetota bacterium]